MYDVNYTDALISNNEIISEEKTFGAWFVRTIQHYFRAVWDSSLGCRSESQTRQHNVMIAVEKDAVNERKKINLQ